MMNEQKLRHVFGPVPSRRLGRSLGIDLVPFKVCSFDCIYCQLGRTTTKTMERKEYIPLEEIIADLDCRLAANCEFDYITLSGSGEPTLYSKTGELIEAVKKRSSKPVAVLTNGSLLWNSEVRDAILGADLVLPSLDAGNQRCFDAVNRPCEGLVFEQVVDGLEKFTRIFKGKTWLEVFLLDGISDPHIQAEEIAKLVRRISPAVTQLNTVARPPCESYAKPLSREIMEHLSSLFPRPVEIIADFVSSSKKPISAANKDDILNLLRRRPCNCNDISVSLCVHYIEALKILEQLVRENIITVQEDDGKIFYKMGNFSNE
jgi:wyosine [tRNA(Phe)-imidazoG37] synthetase (radical SAM superfamily)